MKNNPALNHLLAIGGTVLVWIPLVFPLIYSLPRLFFARPYMVDYLMPAELAPSALLGGLLLLAAAWRAHFHRSFFGWDFAGMVGLLALMVFYSMYSGIDVPGEPSPLLMTGFFILLIAYILTVLLDGIVGIHLIRKLFQKTVSEPLPK